MFECARAFLKRGRQSRSADGGGRRSKVEMPEGYLPLYRPLPQSGEPGVEPRSGRLEQRPGAEPPTFG